jgi:hypothetical protein
MTIFWVILGIIIVAAAIAVAFDEATFRRKAISSIIGGLGLGVFFSVPAGLLTGIIAPGSANPIWQDMLFAGFLCGIAGGGIGLVSGLMTLGLSLLIRAFFSEQIKKTQISSLKQYIDRS